MMSEVHACTVCGLRFDVSDDPITVDGGRAHRLCRIRELVEEVEEGAGTYTVAAQRAIGEEILELLEPILPDARG